MSDLKQELIALLQSSEPSLTEKLAESRRALSEARKLADSLVKIESVAQLEQQVAAYKYAFTYFLTKETQESLQHKYEDALRAIKVGVNSYDCVLRSQNMCEEIEKAEQDLQKNHKVRTQMAIDEIDGWIQTLERKQMWLDWLLKDLIKARPKAVEREAKRQGVKADGKKVAKSKLEVSPDGEE